MLPIEMELDVEALVLGLVQACEVEEALLIGYWENVGLRFLATSCPNLLRSLLLALISKRDLKSGVSPWIL